MTDSGLQVKGYTVRGTVRSLGNEQKVAHLIALGKALPGKFLKFSVCYRATESLYTFSEFVQPSLTKATRLRAGTLELHEADLLQVWLPPTPLGHGKSKACILTKACVLAILLNICLTHRRAPLTKSYREQSMSSIRRTPPSSLSGLGFQLYNLPLKGFYNCCFRAQLFTGILFIS